MCLREESEPHTYDSSGILAYFNPRFREGSDYDGVRFINLPNISIHASAKEATIDTEISSRSRKFQSTLPRRKRLSLLWSDIDFSKFQSTLPRRKRHPGPGRIPGGFKISIHASAKEATARSAPHRRSGRTDFNPRFREGSDGVYKQNGVSQLYFNPRFREGSDRDFLKYSSASFNFNPRFREGSDEN